MIRFSNHLLVLPAVAFLVIAAVATAGAPDLIPYQGYLRNDDGDPLTGAVYITVEFFAVETGGSPLQTEIHQDVPVDHGVFTIMLGAGGGLPATLWEQPELYIQTSVDGETLSPRRRVGSSPFALRAAVADVALSGSAPDDDWVIDGEDVHHTGGSVGVNNTAPLRDLHVGTGLGITEDDLSQDDIIIEGADSYLGVYSNNNGSDGSGMRFGEMSGGSLVDVWTVKRRTSGTGSQLDFIHSPVGEASQQVMRLTPAGRVGINTTAPATELQVVGEARAWNFNATQELGGAGTPVSGTVYRDNVVYAWGQINGGGGIEASFGIASVTRLGTGHYRIEYATPLNGAAVPTVTAYSANNVVVGRVAFSSTDYCEIKMDAYLAGVGGFAATDYRFLVQVLGRP